MPAIRTAGSEFGITLKIRKMITETANSTTTIEIESADDEAAHQCSILILARGSSASRTPSPKMFSASTVSTIMLPGTIAR